MSEENVVGGKVNVDKYMALLQSESDLKVKLQQLFQKMKDVEDKDKTEIARLENLLSKRQTSINDGGDSLKMTAEINSLKMNLETANSKLNSCRNAYQALEDETQKKAQQIYRLRKELGRSDLDQNGEDLVKSTKLVESGASSLKDDLTRINGVGPKLKEKLYAEGVTQFAQIAAWNADDVSNFDDKLSFKGRITRDEWIKQAKSLMQE